MSLVILIAIHLQRKYDVPLHNFFSKNWQEVQAILNKLVKLENDVNVIVRTSAITFTLKLFVSKFNTEHYLS